MAIWDKKRSGYSVTMDVKPTNPGETEEGAEIIAKKYMEIIQSQTIKKELLSTKDFAEVFSVSKSQQKALRARSNNPIPYIQTEEGGNIYYETKQALEWFREHYVKQAKSF